MDSMGAPNTKSAWHKLFAEIEKVGLVTCPCGAGGSNNPLKLHMSLLSFFNVLSRQNSAGKAPDRGRQEEGITMTER